MKDKAIINFVHANGFPAGSYQTFFDYFTDDFTIVAHEKYGHNPQFPIHKSWKYLVDELITYVEQQPQPVIGVGHSFGGVLSFLAACQRPDLFKGLIMLDPPAMTGIMSSFLKLVKGTSYIDRVTPANKSKIRRTQWPIDTDLQKVFGHRQLFKNFDPRCLDDYINNGIVKQNNKLVLSFDKDAETEIFRHVPTHLSSLKNKLSIPSALIYGKESELYPHYFFKRFVKQNAKITLYKTSGGHMFPLENPMETAKLIKQVISTWS